MKHLLKYLSGPMAFALAFLVFGTPGAPASGVVPTVGTDALAYDCGLLGPLGNCLISLPGDSDGDGMFDWFDPCPQDPDNRCGEVWSDELFPPCDDDVSMGTGIVGIGVGLAALVTPKAAVALGIIASALGITSATTSCYFND